MWAQRAANVIETELGLDTSKGIATPAAPLPGTDGSHRLCAERAVSPG